MLKMNSLPFFEFRYFKTTQNVRCGATFAPWMKSKTPSKWTEKKPPILNLNLIPTSTSSMTQNNASYKKKDADLKMDEALLKWTLKLKKMGWSTKEYLGNMSLPRLEYDKLTHKLSSKTKTELIIYYKKQASLWMSKLHRSQATKKKEWLQKKHANEEKKRIAARRRAARDKTELFSKDEKTNLEESLNAFRQHVYKHLPDCGGSMNDFDDALFIGEIPPYGRELYVFNRATENGLRRVPTLAICVKDDPVIFLNQKEVAAISAYLPKLQQQFCKWYAAKDMNKKGLPFSYIHTNNYALNTGLTSFADNKTPMRKKCLSSAYVSSEPFQGDSAALHQRFNNLDTNSGYNMSPHISSPGPTATFHQQSSSIKRPPMSSSNEWNGEVRTDIPYFELSSSNSSYDGVQHSTRDSSVMHDAQRDMCEVVTSEKPLASISLNQRLSSLPECSATSGPIYSSTRDSGKRPFFQFLCRRSPLPLSDRLFLNPFEKWKFHRRPPFKFIIHIILAVLVATQMFLFAHQEIAHLRITLKNLHLIFFADDFATSIQRKINFHSPAAFEAALTQSLDRYFTINDHTVNVYDTINPYEAPLNVLFKNGTYNSLVFRRDFANNPVFEKLLRSVRLIQRVVLSVGLKDVYYGPLWTSCFFIQAQPIFDYSKGGLIEAWLGWSVVECDDWIGKLDFIYCALHCSAAFLCIMSIILLTRSMIRSIVDLLSIKRAAVGPPFNSAETNYNNDEHNGVEPKCYFFSDTSPQQASSSRGPPSVHLSIISSPKNPSISGSSPPSQNSDRDRRNELKAFNPSHGSALLKTGFLDRTERINCDEPLSFSSSFSALGDVSWYCQPNPSQRSRGGVGARRSLARVKSSAFNLSSHLRRSSEFGDMATSASPSSIFASTRQIPYNPSQIQKDLYGSKSKPIQLSTDTDPFHIQCREDSRSLGKFSNLCNTQMASTHRTGLRKRYGFSSSPDWNSLNLSEKLQLFNWWSLISFVANITHLAGSLWCFAPRCDVSRRLFSLGLACFFSFLNLLRYLEYSPSLYILVRTLKRGLPRVAEFLVSVIPLFFGFCALGMSMFWPLSDFSSLSNSSKTLFSVLNGDEIHDIFSRIGPLYPFLSQLYLYGFTCVFMYVILNVFISIIDGAFVSEQLRADMLSNPTNAKDSKYLNTTSSTRPLPCYSRHYLKERKVTDDSGAEVTDRKTSNEKLQRQIANNYNPQEAYDMTAIRLVTDARAEASNEFNLPERKCVSPAILNDLSAPRYENSADGSLTVWQPEARHDQSTDLSEYDDDVDALGIRLVEGPFDGLEDDDSAGDSIDPMVSTRNQSPQVTIVQASRTMRRASSVLNYSLDMSPFESSSPSLYRTSRSTSLLSSRDCEDLRRPFDAIEVKGNLTPRPEPHLSWYSSMPLSGCSARERLRCPPRTRSRLQRSHTCHTSFGALQVANKSVRNKKNAQHSVSHSNKLGRQPVLSRSSQLVNHVEAPNTQHFVTEKKTQGELSDSKGDGTETSHFSRRDLSPRVQAVIRNADRQLSAQLSFKRDSSCFP